MRSTIDFYTQIHKALRRWLFNFSINISTTDFTDHNQCRALDQELSQLFALLRAHAHHEEAFFHPVISKYLAATYSETLSHEHEAQEKSLIAIEKISKSICENNQAIIREQHTLLLYKTFNNFIADYLQHLNEEETIMPLLQERCTDAELLQPITALITSLTTDKIMESITYMLPALNPQERTNYMTHLLQNADEKTRALMQARATAALQK